MPICVALLKYGYHNFSVTILEICDIDIDSVIFREKYLVYSGEYNILKTPGLRIKALLEGLDENIQKLLNVFIEKIRIAAYKRSS